MLSSLARDWRTTSWAQKLVLLAGLLLLGLFSVYPFLVLIEKILFSSGSFDLSVIESALMNPQTVLATLRSFEVSASVAALSLFLGVPLAWLLTRTNLPGREMLRSWLCLPYVIPPYVGAIAWIALANPTSGILNQLVGVSWLNIYSFAGLVWVETCFMYTFILLTALSSLDRMDSSFEEAARLSGASTVKIFFDITLPLIRPALLSGALLAFLATAASFGVPALIGSPAHIYLLTTQIYTFQKMGTERGLLIAGSLSLILLFFAALTLSLNQWFMKNRHFRTVSGKTSRPAVFDLGRYRIPSLFLVLLFFALVFIVPLSGVFVSALSRIQGSIGLSNFTFDNIYRTLFEVSETPRALFNSLILGISAATVAGVVGLVLAYLQVKTRVPGRGAIDVIASLPYSAAGTVVALALILTMTGGFFGLGNMIYGSLAILLIAYVVKYLSFSVKTAADGFYQIDDCLSEAARVSGATWFEAMRTIWIPLMRPALVAAWFLVFVPVVSELTMTLLLAGPGQETVGTLIYQLQEYSDASGGGASVLALLIVVFVLLTNLAVKKLSQGKYGL